MERRSFLRAAGSLAVGTPFIFSRQGSLWAQPASSPLAIVHNSGASLLKMADVQNLKVSSFTINNAIVQNMVDGVVKHLTGKPAAGVAWESFFPAGKLSAATKVAIKINQAYYPDANNPWDKKLCPYGSKAPVINAIVGGLTQMLDGTFPIENITVYENLNNFGSQKMVAQGFPASTKTPYSVSGTGKYNIILVDRDKLPQTGPSFMAGPSGKQVKQVMVPQVAQNEYWIAVTIPKDHSDQAGFTGALKITYGSTCCAQLTHNDEGMTGPGAQACICDFYKNITAISPCILHLLDGLAGIYDGGPNRGSVFGNNVIAASRDPLTMDYFALNMVNEARQANKLRSITVSDAKATNEDGHLNASYLFRAANPPYSFGNFNNNQVIAVKNLPQPEAMPSLQFPQARSLNVARTVGGWRMELLMDASGRRHAIASRVVDLRGREVRSFGMLATRSPRAAIDWDGHDDRGSTVGAGMYCWEVRIDGQVHSQTVFVH